MDYYGILQHKTSREIFMARFDGDTGKITGAYGPTRLDRPSFQPEHIPYTRGIAAFISRNPDEYCLIHVMKAHEKYFFSAPPKDPGPSEQPFRFSPAIFPKNFQENSMN